MMILDDKDVISNVYKPLNQPFYYNDLFIIIEMEVDEYVWHSRPPKTSLDSFIKLSKPLPEPKVIMIDNSKKYVVQKDVDLEILHSKGYK